jgi:UDP-sugar pyrophosphorylase
VPSGVKLEFGDDEFNRLESVGLRAFGKIACVLVAGGLGERLGYNGIKLSLPTETTTCTSYLQLYMEQILARQTASNLLTGESWTVPLAIMTSDDTHAATVRLLEEHAEFGAAPGQITIMKQEKVAAIVDNEGHMTSSEESPYAIDTKPHGHGDVHVMLLQTGLARKWADEGRTHVLFFQDTNSPCFLVSVAALGVSIANHYVFNSIAVPRKAKDAVGAITCLRRADGSSITINVEYNQLEPMLLASGFPEGDVNDASGFSPFPGNINQLIISLPRYAEVLEETRGLVPEFVNPKYKDDTKTVFKKPTRLECMMQDFPLNLRGDDIVGFTQTPEWTYSPVKNSTAEAKAKMAIGVPGRSAPEGEFDVYDIFARQMRLRGCNVAPSAPMTLATEFGELALNVGPRLVFSPRTSCRAAELAGRFSSPSAVNISAGSTLVVDGDVTFESLDLDGALVIKACPGASVTVKSLTVKNRGHEITPLAHPEDQPEWIRIRGFTISRHETVTIEIGTPGEHIIAM